MAKLKIAVAGLGRIGWQFHMKSLAKHRRFSLVAALDPLEERRREATETFGVQAYASLEDLLAHPDLDAVALATPTHLHREHAVAALKAGLHVVLEKPMARDLKEARAIAAAARRHGRLLTVYQPHRVSAEQRQLKALLQKGAVGQVHHIRLTRHRYVRRDDWQSLKRYGGGMLGNYGAHAIDQLLDLVGYDLGRVYGQMRRAASLGDAEDVVKVVCESKAGIWGEIDINQASVLQPNPIEVWGSKGGLVYSGGAFELTTFSLPRPKDGVHRALASPDRAYPSDEVRLHHKKIELKRTYARDFYANFADAVQKGKEPIVRPEQTLEVMRTMDRVRQSAGRIRQPD